MSSADNTTNPAKTEKWADILFIVLLTIVMTLTVIGHVKMEMDGHKMGTPDAPFIF